MNPKTYYSLQPSRRNMHTTQTMSLMKIILNPLTVGVDNCSRVSLYVYPHGQRMSQDYVNRPGHIHSHKNLNIPNDMLMSNSSSPHHAATVTHYMRENIRVIRTSVIGGYWQLASSLAVLRGATCFPEEGASGCRFDFRLLLHSSRLGMGAFGMPV